MDAVIKLLGPAGYEEDASGIRRPVPGEGRQVFAKVWSVTRSEFFEAGRAGYKPELVFSVWAGDYSGEGVIEYNDESYAVYRTFRRREGDGSDYIELYAERKAGTDGEGNRT